MTTTRTRTARARKWVVVTCLARHALCIPPQTAAAATIPAQATDRRLPRLDWTRTPRWPQLRRGALLATALDGANPTLREPSSNLAGERRNLAVSPTMLELLRFAGPCLGALLTSEVMSVIDTSVVGSSSTVDLAALAPAALVADTSAHIFHFLAIATTSTVSAQLARGRAADGFTLASNALSLAATMGLITAAAVGWISRGLLTAILGSSGTPEILSAAQAYLSIRLVGLPLVLCTLVAQSTLQAAKDPVAALVAVALGGCLNLALDMVLCLRFRLGIVGAALATLAAQGVQFVGMIAALRRKRDELSPETNMFGRLPSASIVRRFLAFCGPLFAVLVGKLGCYNTMTAAVSSGGMTSLASHQVLTSIFYMSCKVGDATSQTVQAFAPATLDLQGAPTSATRSLTGRIGAAAVVAGLLTATAA